MNVPNPVKLLISLGLMALLAGCATTQSTENQLTAAGFKTVVASTPKQISHLESLQSGKITVAKRKGKTFFVYPDKTNKLLYVGGQKQYQSYQQIRMENKINEQNLAISEMDQQTAELNTWNNWGMWGPGWGWGDGYDSLPPY